jgi:PhnB protein
VAVPFQAPGYTTVTAYLVVQDAPAAIKFYEHVFGAKELFRLTMPDGSIAHGEFKIGDAHMMISEANEAWGSKSPAQLGGTGVGFCVYVPDCDAIFAKAVEAGATPLMPVQDHFYGDRSGQVLCPFGHKWSISTHIEDVPPEEYQPRMDAWLKTMGM